MMCLGLGYRTGVPWNESGYSNPKFDEILTQAEGTLDMEKRKALMGELEKIMQEDGPIVQPVFRNVFTFYDKAVQGFENAPDELHLRQPRRLAKAGLDRPPAAAVTSSPGGRPCGERVTAMAHSSLQAIGQMLLTLLAASFLVFAVTEFSPGNVARKTLGPYRARRSQVDLLYQKLHLNDPLLVRYVRWLGVLIGLQADPLQDPALKLDFKDPRGDRYFGNFGYSTLLQGAGQRRAVGPARQHRYCSPGSPSPSSCRCRCCSACWRACGRAACSIARYPRSSHRHDLDPGVRLGVMLVAVFVVALGCAAGHQPARPRRRLVDRGAARAAGDGAGALRLRLRRAHGARLDGRGHDAAYIRTAVLKGLPRRHVILRHALRNAMIAPFTVILLQINWLIGGVVVTELVFAYPGFGRMLLEASLFGDISLIEAATLVALFVAASTQLLSDLGYSSSTRRSGAEHAGPRSVARGSRQAAGRPRRRACCAACRAPASAMVGLAWSCSGWCCAMLAPMLPLRRSQRAGLLAMAHPGRQRDALARRRSSRARHALAPDLGRAHGA